MSQIACIEDLAPILTQAEQHPEHGGVMPNDAIAAFYNVSTDAIRGLKKKLTDEQAIAKDKHWLTGANNKTLWTFRGFLRLGMRLTSAEALAIQAGIEELLTMLNAGQVQIVPVEGQPVGVELVPVETPTTALATTPTDPVAIGHALGAAKYEAEQQQQRETAQRITDAAMARYRELKQGEQPLGESLAQSLGLSLETVTAAMQGAA